MGTAWLIRAAPMRKLKIIPWLNFGLLLAACGGKTASNTATTSSAGKGENSSSGASGNMVSGAGNGNSFGGGSGLSLGGTNGAQGGRATGGIVSVGGATSTGGHVGTGGVSGLPCGLSDGDACAAANNANCGSIVNGCGVAHDCGICAVWYPCGAVHPISVHRPLLPLDCLPLPISTAATCPIHVVAS